MFPVGRAAGQGSGLQQRPRPGGLVGLGQLGPRPQSTPVSAQAARGVPDTGSGSAGGARKLPRPWMPFATGCASIHGLPRPWGLTPRTEVHRHRVKEGPAGTGGRAGMGRSDRRREDGGRRRDGAETEVKVSPCSQRHGLPGGARQEHFTAASTLRGGHRDRLRF